MLDELRWNSLRDRTGPPSAFHHAARSFSAPRFRALYRAWLDRGDPVLDAALSPTLADAIDGGTGRLDCLVLSHRYQYLLPLVGTA